MGKENVNPKSIAQKVVICSTCRKPIHEQKILEQAQEIKNVRLPYLEDKGTIMCVNCTQYMYQKYKLDSKNKQLQHALNVMRKTSSYSWKQDGKYGIIESQYRNFEMNFQYHAHLCYDNLYLQILEKVDFVRIDVSNIYTKKDYSKQSSLLSGSIMNELFDVRSLGKSTISLPNDGNTIGIIDFRRNNNFVIITKMDLSTEESYKMAEYESRYILKQILSPRAGAVGGVVCHDSNSHSLTKCTKNNNTIFINHKMGVGASVIYTNKQGDTKLFNGVYNDIPMRRLSNIQKKKEMLSHTFLRCIHIKEMTNRFKALVVAKSLGLLSKKHDDPIELLTNIITNYESDIKNFMEIGHSMFESIMLAWSTTTGQMNNHCALHAHKDGNLSHEVETMTLFGRSPPSRIDNSNIPRNINQLKYKSGYLLFPLDGLVIKMKCNTMNIHCNLKHTLHVPDKSRNSHNWSKVHGPKSN
jgi:hypothetical protein